MLTQSEVRNDSPGVKRDELAGAVLRERQLEPVDEPLVQDEADDAADHDRAQADEHPLAQLVEVLDERSLLTVVQAPRKPRPRWHPGIAT